MRTLLIGAAAVAILGLAPVQARAVGCLSGATMGAIGGHMAGHGVLGAIGGCIAGHEWHKHQMSQQNLQNRDSYVRERQQQDPSYRSPWQND